MGAARAVGGFLKRWVVAPPNAVLRWFAEKLIVGWLHDVAAGKLWPEVLLPIYERAKGWKTYTAAGLGLAGFIVMTLGHDSAAKMVMAAAGILGTVGLADKALAQPGRPEWLATSPIYKLLADNAGFVGSTILSAGVYVMSAGCEPLLGLSCVGQAYALLGITLTFVYVGILDVAFLKTSPWASRIRFR